MNNQFVLICDKNNRELITQKLDSVQLHFEAREGDYFLVESGMTIPEESIAISFPLSRLSEVNRLLRKLTTSTDAMQNADILSVKDDESVKIVKIEAIIYFYSEKSRNFCQLQNTFYETNKRLYEIEKLLFNRGFIRVSKTHIVNIMKISEIHPWFGGRLLLKFFDFPEEVEVSRRYAAHFKDYICM